MSDSATFLWLTSSWWQVVAEALGALGTIAAVVVAVRGTRTARQDADEARQEARAARAAETDAQQRAVEAEREFRARQMQTERQLRDEDLQRQADQEARRLAERQAVDVYLRPEWGEVQLSSVERELRITVGSINGVLTDVVARYRGQPSRGAHPTDMYQLDVPKIVRGGTSTSFIGAIPGQDPTLPEVEAEFTDQRQNRWLLRGDTSLELLNPKPVTSRRPDGAFSALTDSD